MNQAQQTWGCLAQRCAESSNDAGYLCIPASGNSRVRAVTLGQGHSPAVTTVTFDDSSVLYVQFSPRDAKFFWAAPEHDVRAALLGGAAEDYMSERAVRQEHTRLRAALRRLAVIEQLLSLHMTHDVTAAVLQNERRTILSSF